MWKSLKQVIKGKPRGTMTIDNIADTFNLYYIQNIEHIKSTEGEEEKRADKTTIYVIENKGYGEFQDDRYEGIRTNMLWDYQKRKEQNEE